MKVVNLVLFQSEQDDIYREASLVARYQNNRILVRPAVCLHWLLDLFPCMPIGKQFFLPDLHLLQSFIIITRYFLSPEKAIIR